MDESKGRLPTGTVTFLFSDIEGSTRLAHELDVSTYRELIEQHHRLLRAAFDAHGGVERGTQGDEFLVVFQRAPSAVAAAVDAQRSLDSATWPAGAEVHVRMGLHSGVGVHGGDDYVGLDINRAARIASAAHGGQVLISDSTRALSERELPEGVAVRDSGEHRLKSLDLGERLYQLTIEGLRADFPPLRSVEVGTRHLPPRMTSFVGRRAELDALQRLLNQNRLITLVGPGGVGKTSLATELAREVAGGFADGARFVDLAPLTDPALIGPTVARSLGLTDQADRPIFDLLMEHLAPRELLLVLDNFEHLLAASEVVMALLAAAPGLQVVVTSRSILNLYGEQEFVVPPFALPDQRTLADPGELEKYDVVRLFVERARATKPEFWATDGNAAALAEICVRLDGLPLAVELAASRIRLLEPEEILHRLEQHLPVLSTTASNVLVRHRTLHGTIEWSYGLLPPAEQQLFARFAVFAGGCTFQGAEAVCNPDGELKIDTFDGIASLVDQSLIRQKGAAGESRFEMLETIRGYGLERLTAEDILDEIGRRHLRYFKDLAETGERHFVGPDQTTWLDRFEREHDNVRVALGRAVATRDADTGLHLAAALWRFWYQRGFLREGRDWLQELVLLQPDAVSAARAKAFTALGGLAYWLSDADGTQAAYESAVWLYRQLDDREAEAEALYNLAFVPVMRLDPDETRRRFQESLAMASDVGLADLVAKNQLSLGVGAREAGDVEGALSLFEKAVPVFREADDRHELVWGLGEMAAAYHMLGRRQEAYTAYRESLALVAEARNLPGIGAALELISSFVSSEGRYADAIRMTAAADALRETTGATPPLMLSGLADVEQVARREIGEEAVERALDTGRLMTVEEAVEYAASLADRRL